MSNVGQFYLFYLKLHVAVKELIYCLMQMTVLY